MRRSSWLPSIFSAAALLSLVACEYVPTFLFRAADLHIGSAPETLAHFRLNGTLENELDGLKITSSNPNLEYQLLSSSGAEVATLNGQQESTGHGGSEDRRTFPLLEIDLLSGEIPGTISLWVHLANTDSITAVEFEEWEEPTASVAVVRRPLSMDESFYRYDENFEPLVFLDVDLPTEPGEYQRTVARGEIHEQWVHAGHVPEGKAAAQVYHVALTVDAGGVATLYVNGSKGRSAGSYASNRTSEQLYLLVALETVIYREFQSSDPDTGINTYVEHTRGLTGVSNLRIYAHALKPQEIQELYETEHQELAISE